MSGWRTLKAKKIAPSLGAEERIGFADPVGGSDKAQWSPVGLAFLYAQKVLKGIWIGFADPYGGK